MVQVYHWSIKESLMALLPQEAETPLYEQIYHYVRQIPEGNVATYGQIAKLIGRCSAQMVGFALAALKGKSDVPWHRVINRMGKISPHGYGLGAAIQKELLLNENVAFDSEDVIDLKQYQWDITSN